MLEDDSYMRSILQINKHATNAKVKKVGYDSSQNQCIQLSKLRETASDVVKTFLRGKEKEIVSLRL